MYTISMWVFNNNDKRVTHIVRKTNTIPEAMGYINQAYNDWKQVTEVHIYRRKYENI